MNLKRSIWPMLLILLAMDIFALGIAPAKSTLDFKPEQVHEGRFRIIAEDIPSKVILTVEGELADYIFLEKEVLILEQQETWVDFDVKMPLELLPGERRGSIVALEVPKDSTKENVVMATIAVVHQVRINVPYPGKYMTGRMYITNTEISQPISFTIALKNFGAEKVNNAKATIVIKGPTNEEIGVFYTDEKQVNPNTEESLTGYWQTENAGTYIAEATVEYDGKTIPFTQSFNVGNLELEIEKIQVNNFKIGQIAKLDISLRNKWNRPLTVNGKVDVFKDSKVVSSFSSVPVEIKENSNAVMEAYWNTENIEVGEYDISVKAEYDGKTTERTFSSVVSIDNIEFNEFVSAKVVSGSDGKRITLLVVAVIVLIGLNISLFVYINKKMRKKEI